MTDHTTQRSAPQALRGTGTALPTHGTPDLFAGTPAAKPSRRPRRVMMHVFDTSESACCTSDPDTSAARFSCAICGHETDWMTVRHATEAKLGIPCPDCNHDKEATRAAWKAINAAWQAGNLEFRSSRDGSWYLWTLNLPPNEQWPGWPPEQFRSRARATTGTAGAALSTGLEG